MTTAASDKLRSVQIRTTAIATVAVVVVLAAGALGVIRLFEQEQIEQVDAQLAGASRFLEQISTIESPLLDEGRGAGEDTLIQAVDAQGTIIYASDRLVGRPAMRTVPTTAEDGSRPITTSVDGVGAARVIIVPFRDAWVLFASSLQGVEQSVATLRTVLFLAVPFFAAALALVLWVVVGKTLQPVRLAIEREERLVVDVSHELRTPIAGVRALLESESDVPAEIELNRLEALAVLARLEGVADGLLAMARRDGTDARPPAQLVDLDEVALRVVGLATPPAGVRVDASRVSGGQVRGNEDDLERMVSNLVNNALRHASAQVQVALDEHGGSVRLTVGDDGPGIPVEDRDRIYERFTRLDDARSRDRGGAGLGLAIVRSVVDAHGGTITTGTSSLGGAEFLVTLPASTTDRPRSPAPGARAPR